MVRWRVVVGCRPIGLGVPLLVCLFLGGWDMGLLFAQLANLADHYREADAIRRIAFSKDLQGAFIAAVLGVVLVRIPRFLKRLETALAPAAPKERQEERRVGQAGVRQCSSRWSPRH